MRSDLAQRILNLTEQERWDLLRILQENLGLIKDSERDELPPGDVDHDAEDRQAYDAPRSKLPRLSVGRSVRVGSTGPVRGVNSLDAHFVQTVMNSIPVFKSGGHVVTSFIVTMTAYPGQFAIFVDEEHPEQERMQNIKRFLQQERRKDRDLLIQDPEVQRFTAKEVMIFLNSVQKIV